MPPKSRKTAAADRLIGYARVSTDEQGTDPQRDELGDRLPSDRFGPVSV